MKWMCECMFSLCCYYEWFSCRVQVSTIEGVLILSPNSDPSSVKNSVRQSVFCTIQTYFNTLLRPHPDQNIVNLYVISGHVQTYPCKKK